MVYTDFPDWNYNGYQKMEYSITGDLVATPGPTGKTDNSIFNTKIYAYHELHPDDDIISTLIDRHKSLSKEDFMRNCYTDLIQGDQTDTIYSIIYDPTIITLPNVSNAAGIIDDDSVCQAAVLLSSYSIIDTLCNNGYDLNRASRYRSSLVEVAVRLGSVAMCEYLINRGCGYVNDNCTCIYYALRLPDPTIFNYFMGLDISTISLNQLFLKCSSTMWAMQNNAIHREDLSPRITLDFSRIKQIVEKGVDLSVLSDKCFYLFASYKVKQLQYFLDNGLRANREFMKVGFSHASSNIIDVMLANGIEIDDELVMDLMVNITPELLKLLVKYNVDLSKIPVNVKYQDLIDKLEGQGLSKDALLSCMMAVMSIHTLDFMYNTM